MPGLHALFNHIGSWAGGMPRGGATWQPPGSRPGAKVQRGGAQALGLLPAERSSLLACVPCCARCRRRRARHAGRAVHAVHAVQTWTAAGPSPQTSCGWPCSGRASRCRRCVRGWVGWRRTGDCRRMLCWMARKKNRFSLSLHACSRCEHAEPPSASLGAASSPPPAAPSRRWAQEEVQRMLQAADVDGDGQVRGGLGSARALHCFQHVCAS